MLKSEREAKRHRAEDVHSHTRRLFHIEPERVGVRMGRVTLETAHTELGRVIIDTTKINQITANITHSLISIAP